MGSRMRVAMLYYPMLFQRTGGLQVQVLETTRALKALGVDAELFDCREHKLRDFDFAHVFSAINGNHRIVQAARSEGLPVVLSTVLGPPWTRAQNWQANILSQIIGRLTSWEVKTSHLEVHAALNGATAIVALGATEKRMLVEGYGVPVRKVRVVPNGIKEAFFSADDRMFRDRFGVRGPYALNVASVSPYKNQSAALEAVRGRLPLVVIGPCASECHGYLRTLEKCGGEWFRYIGVLDNDDPALPSAYAGASVFLLPSRSEVQPISALEALAADCPVVITRHHSLDVFPDSFALHEVNPHAINEIAEAVDAAWPRKVAEGYFRSKVEAMSWRSVATQLVDIYREMVRENL